RSRRPCAKLRPHVIRLRRPDRFPDAQRRAYDAVRSGSRRHTAMNLPRRRFLHWAAAAATLPVAPRVARAETYPARPGRILGGFSAGSASDAIARLIAQALSERVPGQFIVENRVGAAGNIAADAAVHAPADGYTLFLVTSVNAINATLYS